MVPVGADTRSPWRRGGDRIVYAALRGVWALLAAAGPELARTLLEGLAAAFARLDRRHRRVVADNLRLAFPDMDSVVRDEVVAASFRNWGRLIAEAVHADFFIEKARLDPDWKSVAAAVAEGREGGRGLLLLTAHTGNFEMLARIFGSLVAPVAVFHRPLGTSEVDDFLVRERRRCGVVTLGRGAAVRDALRILAAGGCVALPLEQNQREGRGIFVDVLGHPACTSTVLARLSLAAGVPVLPVFAVWGGEGIRPVVSELVAAPTAVRGSAAREALIRTLTERYAAEIDRVVRRFPHQWNWAHRRWKTRPDSVPPPTRE